MSIFETSASVQDQIFDAIKVGQEAVLSAVDTLVSSLAPITDKFPTVPVTDQLPNGVEAIDDAFGFAQKLLANQKDFALKLIELYVPAKSATKPAPKSATKAA